MNSNIAQNNSLIHLRQSPNTSTTLICFPYAGGSASVFYNWRATLPNYINLVSIEYPGRGTRYGEELCDNLNDIVSSITSEITRSFKPKTTLALFGHSMGALVAFEVAQYLIAGTDVKIQNLFVSGTRAPHIRLPKLKLHNLPIEQFKVELSELGGMPDDIFEQKELMELFLPIIRADITACETYEYKLKSPLNCPITAFGGSDDYTTPLHELREWSKHTSKGFTEMIYPGGHFFYTNYIREITQVITKQMNKM